MSFSSTLLHARKSRANSEISELLTARRMDITVWMSSPNDVVPAVAEAGSDTGGSRRTASPDGPGAPVAAWLWFTPRVGDGREAAAGFLMDPWGAQSTERISITEKFEDNFKPEPIFEKLSDSAEYLAILERKLQAVRSKNKVVENLQAYRADCLERLLRDGCDLEPVVGDTEQEKLLSE
ncbi:hypothetical protein EVAR_45511_1 [Eumeta japonica]|uniref:Uncharacterized protein n=1 Tax=Eumeta variegata TaxID=151549 RepID=A0A4C1WHD4_EUMVA|nr:hypothetical protein EVAR_45511_1 [Eumeta japonica]